MKRLLFLPLLLGLTSTVQAAVDPEIHKLCLKASDYKGCVEAQSGEVKSKPNSLIANSCPPSFAYNGAGYCRKFVCTDWGKEVAILKRKHVCKRPFLGIGRTRVVWVNFGLDKKIAPAFHNPLCPNRETGLGWGSTCDEDKGLLPEIVSKKRKRKPVPCLSGKLRPNHPLCRDDEDKIMSPMDMD